MKRYVVHSPTYQVDMGIIRHRHSEESFLSDFVHSGHRFASQALVAVAENLKLSYSVVQLVLWSEAAP